MADGSRERDAIARARTIARRVATREDVAVRERIERFKPKLRYAKRELLHDDLAWARFLNEIFHHALRLTAEFVPQRG